MKLNIALKVGVLNVKCRWLQTITTVVPFKKYLKKQKENNTQAKHCSKVFRSAVKWLLKCRT